MLGHPPARRRTDADALIASARRVMALALTAEGLERRHRKALLDRMLWSLTEEPWGKLTVPFRSAAALRERSVSNLRHEHVWSKKTLIAELFGAPDQLDVIVERAVACVVTKDEAQLLDGKGSPAKGLEGWARYRAVTIDVMVVDDRGGARPLDLDAPDVAATAARIWSRPTWCRRDPSSDPGAQGLATVRTAGSPRR